MLTTRPGYSVLLVLTLSCVLRAETPNGTGPTSAAVNLEAVDPAVRTTTAQMADPSRIKVIENPRHEDPAVEAAARSALPCQNIAYRNLPTSQISVYLFGGPPGDDNVADDCTLPSGSSNRFICGAQVTTLGYVQGGPPTYNLNVQVWSDCPDNPGAVLISQGSFFGIPNDGIQRVQTVTVDPPQLDDDDTLWVLAQSDNPDAAWEIARSTSGVNDVGSTLDLVTQKSANQSGCIYFFFGGNPYAGLTCTLFGSAGPMGSCCDLNTGVCTDGVLHGSCGDALNQHWNAASCANGPPCVACTVACAVPGPNPPNREQEADCFTNYNPSPFTFDPNKGCSNFASGAIGKFWTPLNCTTATSGCGRSGTYTFLNVFTHSGAPQQVTENRRDDDHYLLELTQDTRVTWTVKGRFPSQAIVSFTLKQTNGLSTGVNCPTYVATEPGDVSITDTNPCNETVATACLPGRDGPEGPFRYFLRARPAVPKLGPNALCGLPYEYLLACEPCVRAPSAAELGACCTTTACVYTSRLACLILTGDDAVYFQGEGSTCPNSTCTGVPSNDICVNKTTLTCSSCVVTYDTTFAGSEGQSFSGGAGQVFKDVWYKYTVQQPGACSNGRVIVSNIGTCFNSKIQMLRVSNCNASQTSQCNALSLIGGVNLLPLQLEAGPPIVNVGPFVYGRSSQAIAPSATNGCVKLRVGGLTENDFGPGLLRVDFVCAATNDSAQAGWNANAGRCCFPDGSCQILPSTGLGSLFNCCGVAGGYIRNRTDFYEGRTPPQTVAAGEVDGTGCAVLPCPVRGEACFNAWDLNTLFGGGSGTFTRESTNRIYFKYVVPMSAPVGSGITINTCGSRLDPSSPIPIPLDSAFAVYRGQFSSITGECDGSQSAGVAPCIAAYNNTEIARVNDCGPHDARSSGANGSASCYDVGEISACLCLQVISSLGTPIAGQVRQGDTIYIGVGAGKSDANGDSTRPFFDPIRSECGGPVEYSIQVAEVAACFNCSLACPGGATPNPEPLPGAPCTNYIDVTNAGCSAVPTAEQLFTPISCGETYCGTSGTYRNAIPCGPTTCPPGETCVSFVCQGPYDNEQDNDWYRLQITQPTRLTWTVNATFAAALQIIHSPTDSCLDQTVVANTINIASCGTTTASADVCAGWVYLVVLPANELGVPCGSLYYATLTCDTVANSCCKGDMNNDGIVDGRDIRPWINQLLPVVAGGLPAAELDPVFGCFDVLTCRADSDNDYAVTLSDLAGFVVLLLDSNVCQLTECDDSAACHLLSTSDSGLVSNLSAAAPGVGNRCADDFRVTAGTSLSSLCWHGFYFDFNIGTRCSVPSGDSADQFVVTIYDDASGLPGNAISGPTTLSTVTKTDTGVDLNYLQYSVRRFKYEASLLSPVAVTPGTCYWLEIANQTSGQCLWLWETSAMSGNGVCVQKSGGPAGAMNWYSFDFVLDDLAFCVPGLRIDNQDCGLPLGRCCVYPPLSNNGDCSVQIQSVCEIVLGGVWELGTDCTLGCPIIPANDSCANALLITSGPIYSGSTLPPATIDGPAMSCEASCGSECNSANDIWYKWVATANGNATFTMCDAWQPGANINGVPINNDDYRYDSIMVVYDNCPNQGGVQVPGGCNDDACSGSGLSRVIITTAQIGRTYWIRISGWGGTNGQFVLRANQP